MNNLVYLCGMSSEKLDRVGEILQTKRYGDVKIITYEDSQNCTILTPCNKIISGLSYQQLIKGTIKNNNFPSVYGTGYLGYGEHKTVFEGIRTNSCQVWLGMMQRGYSKLYKERCPTYKDVEVCEEWKCFQNFAQWYEENYIEGFQLDKDILVKGNKIYSPETCCFVPMEINMLFTKGNSRICSVREYPIGVSFKKGKYISNMYKKYLGIFDTVNEAFQAYKIAKEARIKEVAEIWKGKIEENVYQALINYQVEITD